MSNVQGAQFHIPPVKCLLTCSGTVKVKDIDGETDGEIDGDTDDDSGSHSISHFDDHSSSESDSDTYGPLGNTGRFSSEIAHKLGKTALRFYRKNRKLEESRTGGAKSANLGYYDPSNIVQVRDMLQTCLQKYEVCMQQHEPDHLKMKAMYIDMRQSYTNKTAKLRRKIDKISTEVLEAKRETLLKENGMVRKDEEIANFKADIIDLRLQLQRKVREAKRERVLKEKNMVKKDQEIVILKADVIDLRLQCQREVAELRKSKKKMHRQILRAESAANTHEKKMGIKEKANQNNISHITTLQGKVGKLKEQLEISRGKIFVQPDLAVIRGKYYKHENAPRQNRVCWNGFQSRLIHATQSGKLGPGKYGSNGHWDLGLCWAHFGTNNACPHGDNCDLATQGVDCFGADVYTVLWRTAVS
jgi:hypothetical protein